MKPTDTESDADGIPDEKVMTPVHLIGYIVAVITIIVVALGTLTLAPTLYRNWQTNSALKIMRTWQQEDTEKLWADISALIKATPASAPRKLQQPELPQLLQDAGFETATLTAMEFKAAHGGSSLGVGPALVIYEREPPHTDDPALMAIMRTSVGIYTRGDGWMPY